MINTSCNSDINKVYVDSDDEITLFGATEDIILTGDNPDALALSLYWDSSTSLSTSDSNVQAPLNSRELTLQLSDSENFSSLVEVALEKGRDSRQFLNAELNALLTRLDFSPEYLAPLYIRLKSELAANLLPSYSNLLKVNVQPYKLSMKLGSVLDADKNDTGISLASPEENGIYSGFMGVAAWYNWWFREANDMLWGNNGDTGVPFEASTAETHWNFWFPEDGGCYYVTLNTLEEWWNALHIDNIKVSGDLSGEMEYNQKSNVWTLNINKNAGTYNIRLSAECALYDKTTDTFRAGAIEKQIFFEGDAEGLRIADGEGNPVQVVLPGGETAIILDLSDPLKWTVSTGEAPEAPDSFDDVLWMSGFDDGISGSWNFDCYLTAYNVDEGKYAAVHLADSLWGWLLYTDNNWGGVMGTDSSDPYNGSVVEGGGNIPAPQPGRYLIDVSLTDMTYNLAEVSEVWYTGLNDDWSLYPMTLSEGCIYQAEVEKYADTPWGVKILLRDDWSLWFGGADGVLRYGWDGFNGDNGLPEGTYVLTVDLAKCTYSYTAK